MKIRVWQIMEWVGAALIALALGFVHPALSIGAVGVYLFGAAIVAQLTEGEDGEG